MCNDAKTVFWNLTSLYKMTYYDLFDNHSLMKPYKHKRETEAIQAMYDPHRYTANKGVYYGFPQALDVLCAAIAATSH